MWQKSAAKGIVGKKRDPGILDPELFLAQIRKVEARLGKLAKFNQMIRKVGSKFTRHIRKIMGVHWEK